MSKFRTKPFPGYYYGITRATSVFCADVGRAFVIEASAGALRRLATNNADNQVAIAQAGTISTLVGKRTDDWSIGASLCVLKRSRLAAAPFHFENHRVEFGLMWIVLRVPLVWFRSLIWNGIENRPQCGLEVDL